ncbi:MAG: hypothetical protein LQ338_007899, partial [Usnochroma carphineum]
LRVLHLPIDNRDKTLGPQPGAAVSSKWLFERRLTFLRSKEKDPPYFDVDTNRSSRLTPQAPPRLIGPPLVGNGHIRVASQPQSLDILRVSRSGISIRSPFLYQKISEIVGYYPSFYKKAPGDLLDLSCTKSTDVSANVTLLEPYGVLMHHFPQLAAFAQSTLPTDPEAELVTQTEENTQDLEILRLQKKHVRHLYEHLKPYYDSSVLTAQKLLENDPPRIAFDMLWYVFKPGTDVYVQAPHGLVHACVVADIYSNYDDDEHHSAARISQTKLKHWVLDLWYLDSDGTSAGRSAMSSRIQAYSGLREVTTLDVCPVSIWDAIDNGERRESIMRRSKLLMKALQQGHLLYAGTMVIDLKRGQSHTDSAPPTLGRVGDPCGDFLEYDSILINKGADINEEAWVKGLEEGKAGSTRTVETPYSNQATVGGLPLRSSKPSFLSGTSDSDDAAKRSAQIPVKSSKTELNSHQLLLLFPSTRAFALKIKQWFVVWADFCYEILPSEESIKNLVLDKDELETIRGLARRQNSKHNVWAADFIEGKGTVEAIAEWLHRPLLALTVADIGTVETRVERELIRWFALAEAWNAVLLVDEADIFLERRQNRDLARNGLVSAFLRRMEYFKGLLFLTTNRVGQIDDAFVSRVHIAIGYKTLSGEDRKRIWHGFFQKLIKERAGKIQVAPGAKKWVLEMAASDKAQLNGRDIRNALQTAITLAEAEAEEDAEFDPSKMAIVVDQSHFQRVLDISHKFHEYVRSIRREDEKKRAAGRYDRNDYWQGESGQS